MNAVHNLLKENCSFASADLMQETRLGISEFSLMEEREALPEALRVLEQFLIYQPDFFFFFFFYFVSEFSHNQNLIWPRPNDLIL